MFKGTFQGIFKASFFNPRCFSNVSCNGCLSMSAILCVFAKPQCVGVNKHCC